MHYTTYGYQRPDNSDTGDIFWASLIANINQMNSHNHDGVTSAPLNTKTVSVPSASWAAATIGGGVYRQLVTLPSGWSYDIANLWFKLSTGEYVFPTVERVSTTTFYVYTNDNSKTYTAYYR